MKPRLFHPARLLDTYEIRVILADVCCFGRPHRRMNESIESLEAVSPLSL